MRLAISIAAVVLCLSACGVHASSEKDQKNAANLIVWPSIGFFILVVTLLYCVCRAQIRNNFLWRKKLVRYPCCGTRYSLDAPFDMTYGELLFLLLVTGVFVARFVLYLGAFPEQSKGAKNSGVKATFARCVGELIFPALGLTFFPTHRNSLWTILMGIPYERAIRYHRWMGVVTMIIMFVHGLGMWIAFAEQPSTATKDFDFVLQMKIDEDTGWSNLSGFLSLVCFGIMGATAQFRRKHFELFMYTHWFFFLLGTVFACLHMSALIPWIAPGVVLLLIDIVIRVYRSKQTTTIVSARNLEGGVINLNLRKEVGMTYEAGQYCFLIVRSLSQAQFHPFSISSGPREDPKMPFSFHIKNMGDGTWTDQLSTLVQEEKLNDIEVDGPYGKPSIDLDSYRCLVLVAGGIGITPCISVLSDLIDNVWSVHPDAGKSSVDTKSIELTESKTQNNAVLATGNGGKGSLANMNDGKCAIERVVLVWSNRSVTPLSWFDDVLQRASKCPNVELMLYITRGQAPENPDDAFTDHPQLAGLPLSYGRPKIGPILDRMNGEFGGSPIGVFACGPGGLVGNVQQQCYDRGISNVHFHKETFLF